MFYSHNLLCRKNGKFFHVWMAAMNRKKLNRRDCLNVNVTKICQELTRYIPENSNQTKSFSLYLCSQLMYGIVVIFSDQVKYVLSDVTKAIESINRHFKPPRIELSEDKEDGLRIKYEAADFGETKYNFLEFPSIESLMREADSEALGIISDMQSIISSVDINSFEPDLSLVATKGITLPEAQISERNLAADPLFGSVQDEYLEPFPDGPLDFELPTLPSATSDKNASTPRTAVEEVATCLPEIPETPPINFGLHLLEKPAEGVRKLRKRLKAVDKEIKIPREKIKKQILDFSSTMRSMEDTRLLPVSRKVESLFNSPAIPLRSSALLGMFKRRLRSRVLPTESPDVEILNEQPPPINDIDNADVMNDVVVDNTSIGTVEVIQAGQQSSLPLNVLATADSSVEKPREVSISSVEMRNTGGSPQLRRTRSRTTFESTLAQRSEEMCFGENLWKDLQASRSRSRSLMINPNLQSTFEFRPECMAKETERKLLVDMSGHRPKVNFDQLKNIIYESITGKDYITFADLCPVKTTPRCIAVDVFSEILVLASQSVLLVEQMENGEIRIRKN
ncbi:Meiotic recombination protein REC8 -like protein [Trichinella pseudospiralis]|uniref:Meiotic recombination protein REC8-like protein n=2 Tax=Trichinella pseudospiralis TaxID=6337 RepID=A0A0V1G0K6_TRIPS|nr:Meiotic recombination protein REC8 -like protein [Trichinella pseudospiralis]KRY91059.1 Meiotic recombination protein REC8 -like protein [Trichinella pseudospiralis]KRZ16976.1 Meiotic recombination protein REC8 -like protein [Trichinella pseudospiralis]KRZ44652.1 Meiotic recombination protein REC8 -like protein [Trichinella pseudospiralis]